MSKFGNLDLLEMPISSFFGQNKDSRFDKYKEVAHDQETKDSELAFKFERMNGHAIDTSDLKFQSIYAQLLEKPSKDNHEKLSEELAWRIKSDQIF